MLAVSALGLNDDGLNMLSTCMNDRTMRQADVNVNGSDLVCVSEIENGSRIFHVLLDCTATAETWRLLLTLHVDSAPQRIIHTRAKT